MKEAKFIKSDSKDKQSDKSPLDPEERPTYEPEFILEHHAGAPARGAGTPPKGAGKGGGNLWYVICREGKVEIVMEKDIGNGVELHTPIETKKEAIEWVNQNYPDKKC